MPESQARNSHVDGSRVPRGGILAFACWLRVVVHGAGQMQCCIVYVQCCLGYIPSQQQSIDKHGVSIRRDHFQLMSVGVACMHARIFRCVGLTTGVMRMTAAKRAWWTVVPYRPTEFCGLPAYPTPSQYLFARPYHVFVQGCTLCTAPTFGLLNFWVDIGSQISE